VLSSKEAQAYIAQRHAHWCQQLMDWSSRSMAAPPTLPVVEYTRKASKTAGFYKPSTQTCTYFLAYACFLEEQYDETIAHEVVHHYCRQVDPAASWHGDLFKFMLDRVCGKGRMTKHRYDLRKMREVSKALILEEQLEKITQVDLGKKAAAKYGLPTW
jgi:predicted SprT family Zn-dependent metalloprotease